MSDESSTTESPLSLELYEIMKPEDTRLKALNQSLPKPPFRIVLSGASGSGKSTLMRNFIFNAKFQYKNFFDEIYYFCASLDDCLDMKKLVKLHKIEDKVLITSEWNDKDVKELITDIETSSAKLKSPPNILLILDDMIAKKGFSHKTTLNVLDEMAIRGRHFNLSYIVSTQKYRALNQNIRSLNATQIIVFSNTSRQDLEKIAEENCGIYEKEDVIKVFRKYLDGKFNFVVIDNKAPPKERFRDSNFNLITME